MGKLEDARKKINEIDEEMARLFCKRMDAVKEIAESKRERGLPVLDESREKEVLKKNIERVTNPDYKPYYANFIKNNMDLSKTYQHKLLDGLKVAYSGFPGAFAHIAAKSVFPEGTHQSYPDFKSTYRAVVDGYCDCAVLPIENSFVGDVSQVIDLAFHGQLFINGVYEFPVVQNLVALPGTGVADIKRVISHPQALNQCEDYIASHGFAVEEASNTAVAALTVSELKRKDTAAIASDEAARIYNLEVIERAINESYANTTRFAVFSRNENNINSENAEFIMFFTVKNETAALSKVISIISENGFNMRALKSRPTKENSWDYYFYVEGEGNLFTENGRKVMQLLDDNCSMFKLVGTFEQKKML